MRRIVHIVLLAALFVTPLCIKAQAAPAKDHDELIPVSEREYILLSFNLNEIDDSSKVINTRHFEAMTYAHPQGHVGQGSIRVDDSVPVFDKEGHMVHSFSLRSNISFHHLYVIDQSHITLTVSADISSLLPTADEEHPINRSNEWTGMIMMPIGERKVIFSSDDLSSKHILQMELLVTRVK